MFLHVVPQQESWCHRAVRILLFSSLSLALLRGGDCGDRGAEHCG